MLGLAIICINVTPILIVTLGEVWGTNGVTFRVRGYGTEFSLIVTTNACSPLHHRAAHRIVLHPSGTDAEYLPVVYACQRAAALPPEMCPRSVRDPPLPLTRRRWEETSQ